MIRISLELVAGLCFLYLGAEGLVRGSVALALRAGLTPLVVGLTVVALGTSSPELVVSVRASLGGSGPIAIGNVVGSNICNIALVLGLSALVRPVRVNAQAVRLQIPFMVAISCVFVLLVIDRVLGRFDGTLLFAGILAYTVYNIYAGRTARQEHVTGEPEAALPRLRKGPIADLLFIVGGLILLAFGAQLFVTGAVSAATRVGVSEAVIGLTIVAFGTSFPELATSLVAALRKEGDIAVGNVIGSNIFNILAILGLASLMRPMELGGIGAVDIAVMILISLVALPMARSGFVLSRKEGFALLLCYGGYIAFLMRGIGR
jgi:cation:H+ antiporter